LTITNKSQSSRIKGTENGPDIILKSVFISGRLVQLDIKLRNLTGTNINDEIGGSTTPKGSDGGCDPGDNDDNSHWAV
jgi:hypothetical protein